MPEPLGRPPTAIYTAFLHGILIARASWEAPNSHLHCIFTWDSNCQSLLGGPPKPFILHIYVRVLIARAARKQGGKKPGKHRSRGARKQRSKEVRNEARKGTQMQGSTEARMQGSREAKQLGSREARKQ